MVCTIQVVATAKVTSHPLPDEVESLTSARANAVAGNEPSDAIRSVNALLTQLDKLKYCKNVLIMSTSNLASAIGNLKLVLIREKSRLSELFQLTDSAFIDRADIVQYVGLPPQDAIYWIIRSCLNELMRANIIKHVVRLVSTRSNPGPL